MWITLLNLLNFFACFFSFSVYEFLLIKTKIRQLFCDKTRNGFNLRKRMERTDENGTLLEFCVKWQWVLCIIIFFMQFLTCQFQNCHKNNKKCQMHHRGMRMLQQKKMYFNKNRWECSKKNRTKKIFVTFIDHKRDMNALSFWLCQFPVHIDFGIALGLTIPKLYGYYLFLFRKSHNPKLNVKIQLHRDFLGEFRDD